jgi:hypothetical protein
VDPTGARARVTAIEPPRAISPVIDERVVVDLEVPLPASPRSPIDVIAPPSGVRAGNAEGSMASSAFPSSNGDVLSSGEERYEPMRDHISPEATHTQQSGSRRPLPLRGIARPTVVPTARDASGRQLPRTYVARRRSPARGVRAISSDPVPDGEQAPDSVSTGVAVTETNGHSAVDSARVEPSEQAASNPEAPTTRTSEQLPEPAVSIAAMASAPREPVGESESLRAPVSGFGGAVVPTMATTSSSEPSLEVPLGRTSTTAEEPSESARYRERAVQLPVTPRSDASKRDAAVATSSPTADRPLAQLLVFALLIATIVLVSAAVGLVVGRWMAQR